MNTIYKQKERLIPQSAHRGCSKIQAKILGRGNGQRHKPGWIQLRHNKSQDHKMERNSPQRTINNLNTNIITCNSIVCSVLLRVVSSKQKINN